MRRAGFMKYQKCQLQLAAYALGLEHTVNIVPEICMTFVATRETVQVFAIQAGQSRNTNRSGSAPSRSTTQRFSAQKAAELEMEAVSEDN